MKTMESKILECKKVWNENLDLDFWDRVSLCRDLGFSYRAIAEASGVPRSTLHKRFTEMGLGDARSDRKERLNLCRLLLDDGLSADEIAESLGVNRRTVDGYVSFLSVKKEGK